MSPMIICNETRVRGNKNDYTESVQNHRVSSTSDRMVILRGKIDGK